MKIVSPYRPFAPESESHRYIGSAFDWVAALRMLGVSVARHCSCPTFALTDLDTRLPVAAHHLPTTERRLMCWILDVSLRYLESEFFDDDTVFVSPDSLVLRDLRPYAYRADLGLVVRPDPKYAARPLLNSVQFWARSAQPRLVAFYREALALARSLPEPWQVWGADSEAIRQLIDPMTVGTVERQGLTVQLLDARAVIESYNPQRYPTASVLDFRTTRKLQMREAFTLLFGAEVLA